MPRFKWVTQYYVSYCDSLVVITLFDILSFTNSFKIGQTTPEIEDDGFGMFIPVAGLLNLLPRP